MNTFTIIQPKVEQKEEPITIIDLIPVGRENAISRNDLTKQCIKYGLIEDTISDADRKMRRLLKIARRDCTILNLSDGVGYYRLTREELQELQYVKRFSNQEDSRAKSTFINHTYANKMYADFIAGRFCNVKPIGTEVTVFVENGEETAVIVGYESRENESYLIVDNGISETKVNVARENKAFKYID